MTRSRQIGYGVAVGNVAALCKAVCSGRASRQSQHPWARGLNSKGDYCLLGTGLSCDWSMGLTSPENRDPSQGIHPMESKDIGNQQERCQNSA